MIDELLTSCEQNGTAPELCAEIRRKVTELQEKMAQPKPAPPAPQPKKRTSGWGGIGRSKIVPPGAV